MNHLARALFSLLLGGALLTGLAGCDSTNDEAPARLRVVHAAAATDAIEFFIDFDLFARDLAFRQASPYTEWKPGLRLLEARAGQAASVTREVLLQADRAYTVLVTGTADAASLVLLEDDRSTVPAGQTRLRLAHAARQAGAVAAFVMPEAGGGPVLDVASLGFGEATQQATTLAGAYDVLVAAVNGSGGAELFGQAFEVGRRYLVVVAHVGSTRALSLFVVLDG